MAAPTLLKFAKVFREAFVRYEASLLEILQHPSNNGLPALAVADLPQNPHQTSDGPSLLEQILGDGILWASVPKARRTREKRLKRKHSWFGHQQYYQLKNDIIMCGDCGSWHQKFAICGNCYSKVREETDAIKAEMGIDTLNYQQPRQELGVVYQGEADLQQHWQDKFLIQMKKKRPTWFHPNLMTKRS